VGRRCTESDRLIVMPSCVTWKERERMRLYSVAIVVEARTTSSDTVDAIMPSIYIELRAAFAS
jgi:hypothetical protein